MTDVYQEFGVTNETDIRDVSCMNVRGSRVKLARKITTLTDLEGKKSFDTSGRPDRAQARQYLLNMIILKGSLS